MLDLFISMSRIASTADVNYLADSNHLGSGHSRPMAELVDTANFPRSLLLSKVPLELPMDHTESNNNLNCLLCLVHSNLINSIHLAPGFIHVT
jgi:hypothetical protein